MKALRLLVILFALSPHAGEAGEWYAVATYRTGTGTVTDPWGLNQLVTPDGRPGPGMDALKAGDTLNLDGESGYFDIPTATGLGSWSYGPITPPATDCTIRSKPGTVAVLRRVSGLGPIAGTLRQNRFIAHRTRFLGITFVEAIVPGVNPPLLRVQGFKSTHSTPAVDVEVAYCKFIMSDISPLGLPWAMDNHECMRIEIADGTWVHHNEFTGSRSLGNSAAIKGYHRTNTLIEDNWAHGNNCGFFPKAICLSETYRRNLIEDNLTKGTRKDFLGVGAHDGGPFWIYDNVLDGFIESSVHTKNAQVHHNLFRDSVQIVRRQRDTAHSWRVWSNILLSPTNGCTPFWSGSAQMPGNPTGLLECDYNLVVSKAGGVPNPIYPTRSGTRHVNFTLAQFRARGFERHSRFVTGGPNAIFDDLVTFRLKPEFRTIGRDGGIVGPGWSDCPETGERVTVADIIDTSRYGPEALVELEADDAF
jgi:hypothetical protein